MRWTSWAASRLSRRAAPTARERHRGGDEADLAVLVLDVELDRVQPLVDELQVLLELAVERGERHRHVDAANLVGQCARLLRGHRLGRRLRGGRLPRRPPSPALVADHEPRAERRGRAEEQPERDGATAPAPRLAASRRARKRSFGSSCSNSIDTGRERYVENLVSATGRRIGRVVLSDGRSGAAGRGTDRGPVRRDADAAVEPRRARGPRLPQLRYPFIDVKQEQEELTELVEIEDETPFILHPGEFVLGSTLEQVRCRTTSSRVWRARARSGGSVS